jgi:hypothetical protein
VIKVFKFSISFVVFGVLTLAFPASPSVAASPQVLYAADWSAGLNGWTGGPSWKPLRGMLVSDGTGGSLDQVLAPYDTRDLADYAVEARIRVIRAAPGWASGVLGLAVRGSTAGGGYLGLVRNGDEVAIRESGGGLIAEGQSFVPDAAWHTYRLEVDGNAVTFLIDGGRVATVLDNRFLTGGLTGLVDYSYQIEVDTYRVLRLR